MLVLTRRVGEKILIGNQIQIMVTEAGNGKCRIGIQAPPEVTILREEVTKKPELAPAN